MNENLYKYIDEKFPDVSQRVKVRATNVLDEYFTFSDLFDKTISEVEDELQEDEKNYEN